MDDMLKPNSDKYLAQEASKEPVEVKKRSGFRDFLEAIRPKNPNSFLNHVLYHIIANSAVNVVEDVLKDGIDHWLHPDNQGYYYRDDRYYRRGNPGGVSYRNYDSMYESDRNSRPYEPDRYSDRTPNPRDIIYSSRATADRVLEEMRACIYESKFCSIAEFYEILKRVTEGQVNITANYTEEVWGWSNLDGIRPETTYNGKYRIRFPRTEHLY